MGEIVDIDLQGRPDLLDRGGAKAIAKSIIDSGDLKMAVELILKVQSYALGIGRLEVGVGRPKS